MMSSPSSDLGRPEEGEAKLKGKVSVEQCASC